MSAFIVGNKHINVMLKAANMSQYPGDGLRYYWNGNTYPLCGGQAQLEAGQKLVDENYRSVNHRYDEQVETEPFSLMVLHQQFTPVEIIKACDCYRYQSCETPDWTETEAYAIMTALRERAIHRLAGYDEAEWNIG